jgi:hypothetical protein
LFHAYGNEPEVVADSCRGTLTSAHAFSPDGYSWYVSPGVPYDSAITTSTNKTLLYWSRERPKIFWDVTGKMTHLSCSGAAGRRTFHASLFVMHERDSVFDV